MHNDKEFNAIVWHTRVLQLEILFFCTVTFSYGEQLLIFVKGKLVRLLKAGQDC